MNAKMKYLVRGFVIVLVLAVGGILFFLNSLSPEQLIGGAVQAIPSPIPHSLLLFYIKTFNKIPAHFESSEGLTSLHLLLNGCEGREDRMDTCLNLAAYLISHGTDINAASKDSAELGLTPLHLTVLYGDTRWAKFLLDRGADVNRPAEGHRFQGMTPLRFARECKTPANPAGLAAVVAILKQHGGHE